MAYDAIVIGGGFYGTAIALYLQRCRPNFKRIILIERCEALLTRASHNNQARIHNGYHYPRSFTTAFRSRINLPRFIKDYPDAVDRSFDKYYAIARTGSKVTARQFAGFCKQIGAVFRPCSKSVKILFNPRLIEEIFSVDEWAFDARILARSAREEIVSAGIETIFNTQVMELNSIAGKLLRVRCRDSRKNGKIYEGRYVFNCTYSGLNQFLGLGENHHRLLKHEIAELALVQMPASLRHLGVTVMDGPFFSTMPFPARNLHSLSHVRYTPHLQWDDAAGVDPYIKLQQYPKQTRVDRMMRDVSRYLPAIMDAKYQKSILEVKTILRQSEQSDGRPILFEKHADLPGLFSILGGKIDNIYDVLARLEQQVLS